MYSGDDETGAQFVLDGGDGVISVTSNVVSLFALMGTQIVYLFTHTTHTPLFHRYQL